jgi:hypothetical protein
MTSEEKLNHLKDFMVYWIDWYASTLVGKRQVMELYYETGVILWSSRGRKTEPTFEKYLQQIENQF